MNLYDAFFVLAFLSCIGIVGLKVYNALRLYLEKPIYDLPGSVLGFVGYFVAWIICMVVTMLEPNTLLYSSLLYLTNWLIIVNVMLFIVELFLVMRDSAQTGIKPYKSVRPNINKSLGLR